MPARIRGTTSHHGVGPADDRIVWGPPGPERVTGSRDDPLLRALTRELGIEPCDVVPARTP